MVAEVVQTFWAAMQRGEVEGLEVEAEVVAGADRSDLAQAYHDSAHRGS